MLDKFSSFLQHAGAMIFHVARAGEVVGEFSEPVFQSKVFAGEILPDDHYWTEGLADWRPVSQYRIAAKTVRMKSAPVPTPETNPQPPMAWSPKSDDKLCWNCGFAGQPKTGALLPFASRATCPKCGTAGMIPINSLVAQRFLSQQ